MSSTYKVDNIDSPFIRDSTDKTKSIKFDLSNYNTNSNKNIIMPNSPSNTTLIDTDSPQQLLNKIINANNNDINNISNVNIKSLAAINVDKLADGSVSNNKFQFLANISSPIMALTDTQTFSNKKMVDTMNYIVNSSDATKLLQFDLSNLSTNVTRLATFPDSNIVIAGTSNNQVLLNKTIDATTNTISNITNSNIKNTAAIDVTKIGTGNVNNTQFSYLSGLGSNAVGISDAQTLSNKNATSSTNNIISRELWVNSGSGSVSTFASSVPSNGQILTATGATTATWQNLPSNINSLNTLTSSTQTFATGTSGTDFNISSSTSTHTYNIPSASATNRGLVTTGAQTFAGTKTFSAINIPANLTVGTIGLNGISGIAFIGASSNGGTNISSLTLNVPTGTLRDMQMICHLSFRGTLNASLTVPTGWQLLRNLSNSTSYDRNLLVYTKNATVSEPSSYTWSNMSPTTNYVVATITTFSGVSAYNIINAEAAQFVASSLTFNVPQITTTMNNTMLVAFYTYASVASSWSISGGMTQAITANSTTPPAVIGESCVVGYKLNSAVGLIGGSGVFPATASNDADVGFTDLLALTPIQNSFTLTSPSNFDIGCSNTNYINLGNQNVATNTYNMTVTAGYPSTKVLTLVGAATQSANLVEVQDSSENVLAGFDNSGDLFIGGNSSNAFKFTIATPVPTANRIWTIPNSSDTFVGKTTTDVLFNKNFSDSTTFFQDDIDTTKKLQFQLANITTGATRILTVPDANTTIVGTDTTDTLINKTLTLPIISSISNSGTITIPSGTSDTLVCRNTFDTLNNKNFVDSTINFVNSSDATKKLQFQLSSISTGTTRTWTIPNANDTFVGKSTTDTMLNKIIDSTTNTVTTDNLRSATTTVSIGTATAPTIGQVLTALSGSGASWQNPKAQLSTQLSSSSTISTTSTTAVTVTGMTVTPVAGTYYISFSTTCAFNSTSAVAIGKVGIYVDAVQTSHTLRQTHNLASIQTIFEPLHTQAIITASGSNVIDIRYFTSSSSNTFFMYNKSMSIIRLY